MVFEKIDLYKHYGIARPENAAGFLDCYIPEKSEGQPNRKRPAMLVIGGGGYAFVSGREKECIAFTYLAESFCSFALDYSVAPVKYPAQLLEGCMAVAYIKENAERYGVEENHVAAVGFSAGGHLTAMLATITEEQVVKDALGAHASFARPDAVVLSYPVITSGEKAHKGSFDNLCGKSEELQKYLSLENRVNEKSSPAFIWSTVTDGCVPCENSLLYAEACKKYGVPFELHIFADGIHGLSLGTTETIYINESIQPWVKLSVTWLKNRGFAL